MQVDFKVLSGAHASLQVDLKVLSGAHANLQVDFKVLSGAHVNLRLSSKFDPGSAKPQTDFNGRLKLSLRRTLTAANSPRKFNLTKYFDRARS